ncbi:unnamed protein product [Cuscuta campestris]|uniref:Aminotransferase-like plant mobile domain-containing protein n=1 Tax=Cuscuta campestris TaxID=132261 RepID=A0A484LE86_9ASTE|nr:unnamed protein product [Cuscuta campestris]
MGDANTVRGRVIGSAVLSYLYRSMCRVSATSATQIGGCLVLLQIWAWERLPMTRPRGVIPFDQLVDVPYGVRWVCYHRWSDCTTHSIRAYRDQLDRLLEGELVWLPYPNVHTLPPYCSAGIGIWTSRIPLIYNYVVEMYYPDRFCRQFGALQHIPEVYVKPYVDATPEYRQWYYLRGRRQIGNPAHQHRPGQRLDLGRHPDGFVPSHEVLRVHELLTECVRALGHASILDHPQDQHAYNLGHIRRRVDRRRDAPAVGVRRGGRAEDEESSEEEEDISADEREDGQDIRAMPQLHDRQSHVPNMSLRPTFHIPNIEVGNRPDYTRAKDNKLLTSELISALIGPKIEEDADYKVKLIMRDVYELFQVSVSYKKAWCAKSLAIQRLYSSWEDSYNKLAHLLGAIMGSNQGTVMDLQTLPTNAPTTFQFRYVFWSFKASIDDFHYCLPDVSVDGTHLYGKYKGTLLIAVAMTGNGEIFPLAFSIVDVEDGESWKWFMTNIMRHVVPPHRHICIISYRHSGIDHAFNNVPELLGGHVTRRFCLRHVRSNFHNKFRSKKLKNMMYKAGKTPSRSEFEQTLLEIASKNQEAYNWLMAIPKHMWALSHDEGGGRYGITTTNSSESFNHVLKGCRCLPVFAIVRFTYDKLVKLFADRRTNGYLWQQSGYNFPINVWKKIKHNEENRLYCRVVQHHAQHGIYSVVVDGSFNNGHREKFAVNLNARTCTCGYWFYINAYSGILMPLPDDDWPTPGYEIVRPTARARTQTG